MLLSDLEDGSSVFVDANIFIYHFSKGSKLNPACSNFLERIEGGKIHGFNSVTVIQEVAHRMMIVEAASILPEIKVKDLVMKRRYGLLSNDALTLQIMEDLKISNLASNDSDFERVNHTPPQPPHRGFRSLSRASSLP